LTGNHQQFWMKKDHNHRQIYVPVEKIKYFFLFVIYGEISSHSVLYWLPQFIGPKKNIPVYTKPNIRTPFPPGLSEAKNKIFRWKQGRVWFPIQVVNGFIFRQQIGIFPLNLLRYYLDIKLLQREWNKIRYSWLPRRDKKDLFRIIRLNIYQGNIINNSMEIPICCLNLTPWHTLNWESYPLPCFHGNILVFCLGQTRWNGRFGYFFVKTGNIFFGTNKCGSNINTECDDISPILQKDGKIFYFSSTGHKSVGGYDLFSSKICWWFPVKKFNWTIQVIMKD